jgi:ankyrin repeat protein
VPRLRRRISDGRQALHRAAEKGHEVVMRLLVKEGADVEARCSYRMTKLLMKWAKITETSLRIG